MSLAAEASALREGGRREVWGGGGGGEGGGMRCLEPGAS